MPSYATRRPPFGTTGVIRMQVEPPEVREAIVGQERLDRPSLIIMDGNGSAKAKVAGLSATVEN